MSELRTLQKCRRILKMFQEKHMNFVDRSLQKSVNKLDRSNSLDRSVSSKCDSVKELSQFSKPKKKGVGTGNRKGSGTQKRLSEDGCIARSPCSQNKQNFRSAYNRQTRYEKIMRLKVKAEPSKKQVSRRNSYVDCSVSSINSSLSASRLAPKRESRYDQIMKLKIRKPEVQSTIKNYQPKRSAKKDIQHRDLADCEVLLRKETKQKMQQISRQEEKEDRLWRVFERERELRANEKKKRQEKQYQRQRSIEKRFDTLVRKQLRKIERQREAEEKRELGFSEYLFQD